MGCQKDIEKLFDRLDNIKTLQIKFPEHFTNGEVIVCMDKETAISILEYSQGNDCITYNVHSHDFVKYVEKSHFLLQGFVTRVLCDSGIGWFIGVIQNA